MKNVLNEKNQYVLITLAESEELVLRKQQIQRSETGFF